MHSTARETESKRPSTIRTSSYPSGSALSTISDLSIFANALVGTNNSTPLFKNISTLSEFYNITKKDERISHGLFQQYYSGRIKGYDHRGNNVGYTAYISLLPEYGFSYVGMSNLQDEYVISKSFHRTLWGLYNPSNEKVISYYISSYYRPTNIVHRGFFKRHDLNKHYQLLIYDGRKQFSFLGDIYNISEDNVFTNSNISKWPYTGKYQITFTHNQEGQVNGLCILDECYENFDYFSTLNDDNFFKSDTFLFGLDIFPLTIGLGLLIFLRCIEFPIFALRFLIIRIVTYTLMLISLVLSHRNLIQNRICVRRKVLAIIYGLITLYCIETF